MGTCLVSTGVCFSDGTLLTTAPSSGFSTACVIGTTSSWTVPAGIKNIKVTAVGGGAGGVGCNYYCCSLGGAYGSSFGVDAGGGAGGAAVRYYSVTPGCTACIVIGAAGNGSCMYCCYCTANCVLYCSFVYPGSGGTSCFCYLGTTICGTGGFPAKSSYYGGAPGPAQHICPAKSGIGVGGQYSIPGESPSSYVNSNCDLGYTFTGHGKSSAYGAGGTVMFCGWSCYYPALCTTCCYTTYCPSTPGCGGGGAGAGAPGYPFCGSANGQTGGAGVVIIEY